MPARGGSTRRRNRNTNSNTPSRERSRRVQGLEAEISPVQNSILDTARCTTQSGQSGGRIQNGRHVMTKSTARHSHRTVTPSNQPTNSLDDSSKDDKDSSIKPGEVFWPEHERENQPLYHSDESIEDSNDHNIPNNETSSPSRNEEEELPDDQEEKKEEEDEEKEEQQAETDNEERYCYCDQPLQNLDLDNDMILCGGLCERWFHCECIDWERDDEGMFMYANYDDTGEVRLRLETPSQEEESSEDHDQNFYCIKCWEQDRKKNKGGPIRFADLGQGNIKRKNACLGFHGKHFKRNEQINNYIMQLRSIIDDDELLNGLLDSDPRPYPTTQHMTKKARNILAIQGRSFEILQLCVSVEECDCCGRVQPYASDPKLKQRRQAFSDDAFQTKLGGKTATNGLFHHAHFNRIYYHAFRCTCEDVCNGCQFYAFDKPKQRELYHKTHGGVTISKKDSPQENMARICKDCYMEDITIEDHPEDIIIQRKFSYRNGFGCVDKVPNEEPV